MNLKKQDIINLPVYTQSGQHLGRVVDFELESNTQAIINYHVRGRDIIKELLSSDLIINREQIISITKEQMIIEDSVISEIEKKNIQKQAVIA